MELTTVLYGLAILAIAFGFHMRSQKKTDVGNYSLLAGVIVAGVVFMGAGGAFAGLTAAPGNDNGIPLIEGVENGDCQLKPYTQLTFTGTVEGTDDPTAPAGSVDFYAAGKDPSSATATRITTIPITSGVGNLTGSSLMACTSYGIIYNGASAEYDQWYNDKDWTQSNYLPYIATTESAIANGIIQVNEIKVVATLPDPIEENAVTGIINGQTNVDGTVGNSNEIQIGADDSPADSDVIYYNKTNGDLSFYLDITLGADGANKWIKDPVLAFENDNSNPMDGNEFADVTLVRQSGTDFGLPTDITSYVNNADAVPMGAWIEGGQTGVYRMQFTLINANLDATSDVMYIYTDDNGAYLGKDILRNTKATAGAVMELQFRE